MVNILFLITGLHVGGAEMQVYQVIKTLKKKQAGYRPIVVSLLPIGPVGDKLQEEGVTVYSLGMERGKPSITAVTRLNRIMKKEKIEIIHSHMYHANILGRLMKLFHPKVKLVNTIHNINIGGSNRERLLRMTNKMADSITIISETARSHFVQVGAVQPEKLLYLPNGVDTAIYQGKGAARERIRRQLYVEQTFVWLAVGRFDEQKNYPNLLESFQKVLNKGYNAKLLIAGAGPKLDEMKRYAVSLNISKDVQFLGLRSDVPDLMSAADGFVMSSDWEGMPLVLLEASSVGLPIVCTDVGGNREVVLGGKTGVIVKPKDSLALSDGMVELLNMSENERKNMGTAAKQYVESVYELGQVVDRWNELYQQVL